jgi:hypothetical protein
VQSKTRATGLLLLGILALAIDACAGSHTSAPLLPASKDMREAAPAAGMCSVYAGFGTLSYCYNFDETAGPALLDSSGAGNNGTISASGVTFEVPGLTSSSSYAETTNGSTGAMTSGSAPASGSFSLSFFVSLLANPNTYVRLAATGNPAHTSPASGWNITVDNNSTNEIYVNMGYGSGNAAFGFIPLPLRSPANVTLTYNATGNVATLCVGNTSSPTCKTETLPAAFVPTTNPVVFGGVGFTPSSATFDEAGYWPGTVLTPAQISTIAAYTGTGTPPTPSPTPSATPTATPVTTPTPVPSLGATPTPVPSLGATPTQTGMCAVYGALGSLSFCYDFAETSGPALLDASGAGNNGTISAGGVTFEVPGLTSNSSYAETTNGTTGAMTSGSAPASGSFSLSFFVSLLSNADNYARLAATGNPAHTSPAAGWNITVDNNASNDIYVNMGYGSGNAAFGHIPLPLGTPANVTLNYNAASKTATLCVGTSSPATCKSQTLPAAFVPATNPIVFGGVGYTPSNATFDAAGYWPSTVLTPAQISTIAAYSGMGTPAPSPVPSQTFTDWPMYQNDAQHDGYVNDAAITPQTVGSLHLVWEQTGVESSTSHEQPVAAANIAGHPIVLYLGGAVTGNVYAYDGLSGQNVWTVNIGSGTMATGKPAGVRGTGAIDRNHSVVYMPDGEHRVHALNLNGLADMWAPVDIAPTSPPDTADEYNLISVGMTLAPNGTLYAATGSAADSSPWEGRLAAINTSTAALTATFYPVYVPTAVAPYSGGGIWDWGGASLDAAGNVYVGVGNADETATATPFQPAPAQDQGYAEQLVQLTSGLTVSNSALQPLGSYVGVENLDFSGTPVIFQPIGCPDQLEASTGKSGMLTIYDTTMLSNGPLMSITVAETSATADGITNPAYSASTGLLYVSITDTATPYAGGQPGMIAIGFSGCTPSLAWNPGTAFGVSSFSSGGMRSAPTVTSGGVVLITAPVNSSGAGALFALDASSGAVLNGGNPIFTANGPARMGPIVDGNWVWLSDSTGDLYGLTIDASTPALRNRSTVRRTLEPERDVN